VIGRWREETGKNGRAATGWEQTLEAASDGRAELLLVQDGADEPAYQCPACGRAQVASGTRRPRRPHPEPAGPAPADRGSRGVHR